MHPVWTIENAGWLDVGPRGAARTRRRENNIGKVNVTGPETALPSGAYKAYGWAGTTLSGRHRASQVIPPSDGKVLSNPEWELRPAGFGHYERVLSR